MLQSEAEKEEKCIPDLPSAAAVFIMNAATSATVFPDC